MKNKNNNNKENWKVVYGSFTTIVSILIFFALFISMGNDVVIEKEKIKISGASGITIKKDDIKSIELIDTMPKRLRRIKGISGGNRGLYELEDNEKAYIYIENIKGPFIKIIAKDSIVYLSFTESKTKRIYENLIQSIK